MQYVFLTVSLRDELKGFINEVSSEKVPLRKNWKKKNYAFKR